MEWTAETVYAEVCKVLEPFNPGGLEITPETDLSSDLNMDSVAAMNVVMEIEDKFDLDIPISVLSDVHTPKNLVDVVLQQLNKG